MTKKTAVGTPEPRKRKKKVCPIHDRPLKYSKEQKTWYCPDCLYSAFLSHQSQQQAVKRYRESDKGKQAQEKYEKSVKGSTARKRYLKSDKYKQRRKEYNQRLKESLAIARAAKIARPHTQTDIERSVIEELSLLVQDIREYQDTMGKTPTVEEVMEWASEVYQTPITPERAEELIEKSLKRR